MITIYLKSLNKVITNPDHSLFDELKFEDLLWIDLLDPTPRERIIIENYLDFTIQTREEAEEIETSSRYSENKGYIQCNSNFSILKDDGFNIEPVSFTIIHDILISMRTCYLRTFAEASRKLQISYRSHTTGYHILVSLLEARIDLDADMVEVISKQIAAISNSSYEVDKSVDQEVLLKINRLQESTMLLRETIFDRQRLLSGAQRSDLFPDDIHARITIMLKDIGSLLNHADFNFERLEFLQDMYMGLINIEQNKIIKIFTVLSVIFMPPTLIASIYGMNFKIMPELNWKYGYLIAIVLMLASMGATLLFFKRKKWL